MNDERPSGLEDFGHRLRHAAAAEIERERRSRRAARGSRTRRLAAALAAILVTGAAAAGATRLLIDDGAPLPGESETPASIAPGAGLGVVASSATPDPSGGLPWAVRIFTNPQGEECVTLGRLRNGQLGQFDGRTFRPLPDDTPGTCANLGEQGLLAAIDRRAEPQPRTIIFGISGGRAPVAIEVGGADYDVRPGGLGAFVVVLEGVQTDRSVMLRTMVDGRAVSAELG